MALSAQKASSQQLIEHGMAAREESQFRIFARRFARNKTALVGLAILVVLVTVAILAPVIAHEPWNHLDLLNKNKPPSPEHWLGTDQYGRDVFSRLVWGSRISLSVGFVAATVSILIGAAYGALAGYRAGSWLDVTLMRIAEAIDSIPLLILLIVVSSVVSRSVYTVMLVIGFTSWPSAARLVRGQFLSLRERDYVQAAQAMGATDGRIIFKHIMPQVIALLLVSASFRIAGAIIFESTLNFLGFGAPPPYPTWGEMLATGRAVLRNAPWVTAYPGILITITVLAFRFVGDGASEAWDPKEQR
ncbi:MAG: ABC transporter permease [Bacillota bacterium]